MNVTAAGLSLLLALGTASASGGCGLIGGPRNSANIELRKENQDLRGRVSDLERQAQADMAAIRSHEERTGTLPTLPRERLANLFTTHDIKLGRLTGGADLDSKQPGHEGLKIYVTPIDASGDPLKAAGAFTVEAFDLSRDERPKIGTWTFDVAEARRHWTSVLNRYNYVLPCPWQAPPGGNSLHVDVKFVDELTQTAFTKSVDLTVDPPAPSTATPTSAPAAGG
jgi:hypothetical protein